MKAILVILLSFSLLLSACGGSAQGGSEAGNPPDVSARSVEGTVPAASSSVSARAGIPCAVDTVIATDSAAQTISADVESDCSFSLSLSVDKAYSIGFVLDDVFVAAMIFNNNDASLSSAVFVVSAGETAINLGLVTISGAVATAEMEPASQNDQDEDGVDDFDDDDDDDDGKADDDEEDCDLDGYKDDYDEDSSSCEDDSGDDSPDDNGGNDDSGEDTSAALVLEVDPRNDTDLSSGDVDLEEEVEVRVSCEIDSATLGDETFQIVSELGVAIECQFDVSGSGAEISCEHEDDLFLPDTIYTATISGLQCADGRTIETASWSWVTSNEEDE